VRPSVVRGGCKQASTTILNYKAVCTVRLEPRLFDVLHKFAGGQPPSAASAAFEVQEMGEKGDGSLELSVASGDIFWVKYPVPELEYFYMQCRCSMTQGSGRRHGCAALTCAAESALLVSEVWGCGRGLEWVAFCGKWDAPSARAATLRKARAAHQSTTAQELLGARECHIPFPSSSNPHAASNQHP
jgi:hypothetical protein